VTQKPRNQDPKSQLGLFEPEFSEDTSSEDFSQGVKKAPMEEAPLAHRLRPTELADFVGHQALLQKYPFLNARGPQLPSFILSGPPGSGKTTLARLIAESAGLELYHFNAVLGGVQDLKKLIQSAKEMAALRKTAKFSLFIDEIHRFNKAQQDALLPYVEDGTLHLIGATTENPRSSINRALLSRLQLVGLSLLTPAQLVEVLERAITIIKAQIPNDILELIADHSLGDARRALNALEMVLELPATEITVAKTKTLLLKNARDYDRNQDRHYDVISAFIKSLRGSDPDAALLWLAVMLDGGEDPVFIARRLVILASEDIGNADPQALTLAVSTLQAVQAIGMPEARINLAQAVCYLAVTPKSNACYMALGEAEKFVSESSEVRVPEHLKKFSQPGTKKYLYPHDYPEHYIAQEYSKVKLPNFYRPTKMGIEGKLKERLEKLKKS